MVTSENVLCFIQSQIALCWGPSVENLAVRNLSVIKCELFLREGTTIFVVCLH